jgi:hypothetical protein
LGHITENYFVSWHQSAADFDHVHGHSAELHWHEDGLIGSRFETVDGGYTIVAMEYWTGDVHRVG